MPRKGVKGSYWVVNGGRHDVKQLEELSAIEASSRKEYLAKYHRNHKNGVISCDWCDLKFPDGVAHRTHMKQKHFWGKFRCTRARGCMVFNFAKDIVDHLENYEHPKVIVQYSEEPYVHCPNCEDTILIKEIVGHYERCVSENCQIFECPSCRMNFDDVNNLNRHWMTDHMKTEYSHKECTWCGKKFGKSNFGPKKSFFLHAHEEHLFGIFFCSICPFQADLANDLIKHIDSEEGHEECPIHCPSCKIDLTKAEFETHYKECITKYVREVRSKRNRTIARCKECGKLFYSKETYIQHLKVHLRKQGADEDMVKKVLPGSKDKNTQLFYHCDKCNKKYSVRKNLRNHYESEHEGKVYKCDQCSIVFKKNSQLKKHMYVAHSTDEKYACKVCGKRFGSPKTRELHELSHKEPQFQCSICAKRLKSSYDLEAHEMEHRGVKPFPCSICGASFTRKGGLGQHLRGVHKITGPRGGKAGWIRQGKSDNNAME